MSKYDWSPTAADNDDADSAINWREQQAPSTVNNSARAMMAAEAVWIADTHQAITTAGTSNAYTATSNHALTGTIPDGFRVYLLPNHTNTGAATLNVDGRGAKNLRATSGSDLASGEIVINRPFTATYRTASDEFLIDAAVQHTSPKNYIVNPGMRISQENGTSSGTSNLYYPVDQWFSSHSQDGTLTFQQVSSATPGGSENRIRMTVTSADTSIAAGQFAALVQHIEGSRAADLQFGTANATDVVVRFGFKGPAGTYAVAIINQDSNRSFVREFTISGGEANTDTLQTLTFPGDTSGAWDKDDTLSFQLVFTFAVGSTYETTADAWQSGLYFGTASTSNGIGTTSNVFEIFDVGLYAGVAPRFQLPHYDTDLMECQRYFRIQRVFTQSPATGFIAESYALGPNMRIDNWSSSVSIIGSSSYSSYVVTAPVKNGFAMQLNATASGGYASANITINARM